MLRTITSPLTHLRNLTSNLMFGKPVSREELLRRALMKKKVINNKTTLSQLKNILKESKKE